MLRRKAIKDNDPKFIPAEGRVDVNKAIMLRCHDLLTRLGVATNDNKDEAYVEPRDRYRGG